MTRRLGSGAGTGGPPQQAITLRDPAVAAAVEQSLRLVWWALVPVALVVWAVMARYLEERPLREDVPIERDV